MELKSLTVIRPKEMGVFQGFLLVESLPSGTAFKKYHQSGVLNYFFAGVRSFLIFVLTAFLREETKVQSLQDGL